mmetsp:Transcript_63000/g.186061  ORF Transcript_63000/g.186061 Transcript_63000/m.186061 type:complete len:222 (+) Transcript_63000:112-777(+)
MRHRFFLALNALISFVSAFQPNYFEKRFLSAFRVELTPSALSLSRETPESDADILVASRQEFLRSALASSAAGATTVLLPQDAASAFEGGVGGLGKTKPETGVVFRDPDATCADPGPGGDVTNELLSPDGTPALVTFNAPWPMLRSSISVESRDLANPETAFVQVAKLPKGKGASDLPKSFFEDAIFGQKGKFGMSTCLFLIVTLRRSYFLHTVPWSRVTI